MAVEVAPQLGALVELSDWTRQRRRGPSSGGTGPVYRQHTSRHQAKIAVAAIVGFIVISGGCADSSATGPGAREARRACANIIGALQQVGARRSVESFALELRSNEADARRAASLEAKYEPLARAVVALQSEIASQGDPASADVIVDECERHFGHFEPRPVGPP
jgi:hypothetical protein